MMKKNLIAAAALLAVAGAANAQMTIYGLIDVSYGKSLVSEVLLGETKAQFHSGGDNGSSEGNSTTRLGFKGSTDLGGGMKANFKLETSGIQSSGEKNGALFGRQMWAGFSGNFGEVRLGRQDSIPFQIMGDFDFNGMSNGVSAGAYSGVGVFNRGRQSRSLQYMTPNMGGLNAQFGYVPKGNMEENEKGVFSAGVKYAAGPLAVGASVQSKPNSASDNFSSVAASYDFGVAKIMAGYANGGKLASGCALFDGCNQNSGKGYTLGITAPIAGWTVGAIYANNNDNNAKIKSTEFFVNKEIFKNTYGYFEAGNWKGIVDAVEGTKKTGNAYAIGVIFVF